MQALQGLLHTLLWLAVVVAVPHGVTNTADLAERHVGAPVSTLHDINPTKDLEVYHAPSDVTSTDLALDKRQGIRAAYYGIGAAGLVGLASITCQNTFVFPAIGPFVCAVALAGTILTTVGAFLASAYPNGKRDAATWSPRGEISSGVSEFGDGMKWYHSRGGLQVDRESVLAAYVEDGPPLLLGEHECDGPDCGRLWYSHTTNASWELGSGTIRRIMYTPKHADMTKRQDHTKSGSGDKLTGAYVWNDNDATTIYDATRAGKDFALDLQKEMAQQNGDSKTGKFSKAGVYCMNIDAPQRMTPLGTTGYLWYYQQAR